MASRYRLLSLTQEELHLLEAALTAKLQDHKRWRDQARSSRTTQQSLSDAQFHTGRISKIEALIEKVKENPG